MPRQFSALFVTAEPDSYEKRNLFPNPNQMAFKPKPNQTEAQCCHNMKLKNEPLEA